MSIVKSDEIITSWVSWLKMLSGNLAYWIAVYKTAQGIQRRKSTKCTGKTAAREFLARTGSGELLASTQSATEEQFRHLIREVASRATGRPFVDPTIRTHLSNWLESEKGTVEASTLKRYRQVARDFETFLGAGETPGSKHSVKRISSNIAQRCRKPGTLRKTSTRLSRFFAGHSKSPLMSG